MTVLSLSLAIATALIWIRSYFVHDQVTLGVGSAQGVCDQYGVESNRGSCQFTWWHGNLVVSHGLMFVRSLPFDWKDQPTFMHRIGFRYLAFDNVRIQARSGNYRALFLPYWAVLFIAMFFASPGFYALVRRKKGTRNCGICGYDLRATPERCPECGSPISPKQIIL